jgi:hypothetical protein
MRFLSHQPIIQESVEDMVTDAKHAFGGPVIAAHDYMWEQVFPPQ